jgi:hypothetical protein
MSQPDGDVGSRDELERAVFSSKTFLPLVFERFRMLKALAYRSC